MAHLAIVGSQFEATVCEKLHYLCHKVAIRYYVQQFEVEPTEPHGTIGSSQVHKYNANFFLCFKSCLDAISQKCDLVNGIT